MARQPAISIAISFQHPFNRAGGRTSIVLLKNKMTPKAKQIMGYIAFAIGVGLFTSMTTVLHGGAEAAKEYQEVISPYVTDHQGIWSGTGDEAKQFDIRIPMDEQVNIRMLHLRIANQLNPEAARWLLYLGVFLLILAAPLMRQPKVTTNNQQAESGPGE